MSIPIYQRAIDDAFVSTWLEIRAEAMDNILLGIPIWSELRARGCFKTQEGGDFITRTVGYGTQAPVAVSKGDVLPSGEPSLDTMGMWTPRYYAGYIQRSMITDVQNAGKYRIKDYVKRRTTAAKDGLTQQFEVGVLQAPVLDESGKLPQGLYDLVPPYASRATGTYGTIARSNSWWQPQYKQFQTNRSIHLIDDMTNLYNTITKTGTSQTPPNLIVTDQDTYELYTSFGLDASQIVKTEGSQTLDLGFEKCKFKGKDMMWSPNIQTPGDMLFLNTNFIDIVYNPLAWFAMGPWKDVALQDMRIAHILCSMNMVSDQLRRHGMLYV